MKPKTIKRILSQKHADFVNSIKDEEVKELVKNNSIITGGAIVSMLLNEPVNDFDYYFTDKETTEKVAKYFVNKYENEVGDLRATVDVEDDRVKIVVGGSGMEGEDTEEEDGTEELVEEGEKEEEEGNYKPVFFTTNAISLENKVQLVTRFFGNPEEIHNNYDFVHTKCYWSSKNNHLELPKDSLIAILTKELKYEGSKYPLASIFRTKKFIERGWTVNAGQYLKMVMQLDEMDLTNPKVLEEQLTGVDFAYFQMIIRDIKEKTEKDGMKSIDRNYLMTVIDRVFG